LNSVSARGSAQVRAEVEASGARGRDALKRADQRALNVATKQLERLAEWLRHPKDRPRNEEGP
jgi:hypothetical protein